MITPYGIRSERKDSMKRKPEYIIRAQERIAAGIADRAAAQRYRDLAERNPSLREDYSERAIECDRVAALKLRSVM